MGPGPAFLELACLITNKWFSQVSCYLIDQRSSSFYIQLPGFGGRIVLIVALPIETNLYSSVERGGIHPLQKTEKDSFGARAISDHWDYILNVKAKNQYKPKKSMTNNQVESIQYTTQKKKEKESVKKNWWGIKAHVFVHYAGGLTLVPFLHVLGVIREYPKDLEICSCGSESPGGIRKSPPGSLYLAELVIIHRECVKWGAKCGASQQCPLPLSDFWENRPLHCLFFLDIFVFIFWIV